MDLNQSYNQYNKKHMKNIFEAKTIIKAQMQPNQAQGGQESQKRLERVFSLPYFSYNLHYTKFIQSKISPSLSCFAGNFYQMVGQTRANG